jgi:predicted RNA binding protein YcfA (HicA-like mRNA interferase family)
MWYHRRVKSERRLAKIRRQVNDTTPEELRAALEDAGFTLEATSASHWIYRHPLIPRNLSIPYRRPLKPVYVRLAIEAIEEVTP